LLTSKFTEIHARVAPDIEWIPQLGMSRHCTVANLTNWLKPFLELGSTKPTTRKTCSITRKVNAKNTKTAAATTRAKIFCDTEKLLHAQRIC
jgi:hypothetical protein